MAGPVSIEGLKAELGVLRAREAEILADAVQMREAGAPAERINALMAKVELLRPRISELERQIRQMQEH
jgi:hypothetical protein